MDPKHQQHLHSTGPTINTTSLTDNGVSPTVPADTSQTMRMGVGSYPVANYPLSEKCFSPNYVDMPGQYSPFGVRIDGCFTDMSQQHQRMFYTSPHPGMAHVPLNHSKLSPSGSLGHHQLSHDEAVLPKFPPQTFEIPDIQDSNSVFGTSEVMPADGGAYGPPTFTNFVPSGGGGDRQSYLYGGAAVSDVISLGRATTSTPGWQQGISSAGSTNSSPVSQTDDMASYDGAAQHIQSQNMKVNITNIQPVTNSKKPRSPKKRKKKKVPTATLR